MDEKQKPQTSSHTLAAGWRFTLWRSHDRGSGLGSTWLSCNWGKCWKTLNAENTALFPYSALRMLAARPLSSQQVFVGTL